MPILLWSSIPCTGGTKWVHYNLRRYPDTFPRRLQKLRQIWKKLTINFYKIADLITRRKGHWAIEWPYTCSYWDTSFVQNFLNRQKVKIFDATATGCAFNLRAIDAKERGTLMSKQWHIKSTVPDVSKYLDRPCVCHEDYVHAQAKGQNTAHSGRYTAEFVSSVHRMFSYTVAKGIKCEKLG